MVRNAMSDRPEVFVDDEPVTRSEIGSDWGGLVRVELQPDDSISLFLFGPVDEQGTVKGFGITLDLRCAEMVVQDLTTRIAEVDARLARTRAIAGKDYPSREPRASR